MLQLEVAELFLKLAGCRILPEVVRVNDDADTLVPAAAGVVWKLTELF
jgi:hypothetical protein